MTEYLRERKSRTERKELNNMALFGIVGGFFLVAIGAVNWLIHDGVLGIFFMIAMWFGGCLIVLGFIYPPLVKYPYECISFLGNKIGNLILWFLLIIIYYILITPIGIIWGRGKNTKYVFARWEKGFASRGSDIGFLPYRGRNSQDTNGIIATIFGFISYVVRNGKWIFLPAIIIMLIIGLILFFVSSSVIAPFIYTLF